MYSKPPTIPFGIVACTFSDNLSRNSCIPQGSYWPPFQVGSGGGKRKILIFLSHAPPASSPMFLKRTKRKIKQLLFTGYLNTTVKHFDVMPIYHIQLFNLFTLPVSLLPHLRDFLFESWSLFQYRALRAVVSPGRTRLAKPLLAGY